jgi:4-hydroxybenzoate polyprenyltransferase
MSSSSTARKFVSLVKLEHTIFALPFAYTGMLLAASHKGREVTVQQVLWITAAMVGARTLAMALNRLIDAGIDARNPRTKGREIPSGQLTRASVWALCTGALALLILATSQLQPVTRLLWPIPAALFLLYPYTKRFTWLCHLVLGACTGLAPMGAWLAITGSLTPVPVMLTLAAGLWIGGFDIIYATQDVEFDRAQRLFSVPARFGIGPGLWVTKVAHTASAALLVSVGLTAGLGVAYWIGVAAVAVVLGYENSIVKADDLSRVDAAFMNANGVVGTVFLLGVLVDHVM